jgi:hypothetical protein
MRVGIPPERRDHLVPREPACGEPKAVLALGLLRMLAPYSRERERVSYRRQCRHAADLLGRRHAPIRRIHALLDLRTRVLWRHAKSMAALTRAAKALAELAIPPIRFYGEFDRGQRQREANLRGCAKTYSRTDGPIGTSPCLARISKRFSG